MSTQKMLIFAGLGLAGILLFLRSKAESDARFAQMLNQVNQKNSGGSSSKAANPSILDRTFNLIEAGVKTYLSNQGGNRG